MLLVSRTLPCLGVEKKADSTIGEGHCFKSLLVDFRVELVQEPDLGSVGVGVPQSKSFENFPLVHILLGDQVFVEVAVGHKVNVVLLEHRLYQNTYLRHILCSDRKDLGWPSHIESLIFLCEYSVLPLNAEGTLDAGHPMIFVCPEFKL